MQVEDDADARLLDDIMSSSNIVYANRSGSGGRVDRILGTESVKEAWAIYYKDAIDRATDRYVRGDLSLRQFEEIVAYALDYHGDPYGVFDW